MRGVRARLLANYRTRALLYAGKPNWALLDTLTPRLRAGSNEKREIGLTRGRSS